MRPIRTIDGDSHFCEIFLDEVRVPVANRVGEENDGWRVANVTLRFERGTAFAQHIIMMRAQIRHLVSLAMRRRAHGGTTAWDDPVLRHKVGWINANIEALWHITQMCVTEAERTGSPAPYGSAVKLRYSEFTAGADGAARRGDRPPDLGMSDDGTSRPARRYSTTCGRCSTRSRPARRRCNGT